MSATRFGIGSGSTLLQRLLGLVDVATDREVWMLYSSVMRRIGPGLLWVYGAEAQAIAVGTTGGGPDIPTHPQIPSLSWDELARDLALASRWTNDIYIHSLEGCVSNGFLERLQSYDVEPAPEAPRGARGQGPSCHTADGALGHGSPVVDARSPSRVPAVGRADVLEEHASRHPLGRAGIDGDSASLPPANRWKNTAMSTPDADNVTDHSAAP